MRRNPNRKKTVSAVKQSFVCNRLFSLLRSRLVGITLLSIFINNINFGQIVYRSHNNSIYKFFNKQSVLKEISFDNEVLPISDKKLRTYFFRFSSNDSLKNLNAEFYDWYEMQLGINPEDDKRFDLFYERDSLIKIDINPLFGYRINYYGSETAIKRWWGIQAYAEIDDWFGIWINFRDQGEFGNQINKDKLFTPETGHTRISPEGGIEYSDVRGGLSIDWDWGDISFQKDYVKIGHGNFGQLILSDKAPSYPFIRFSLYPTEWLSMTFIHGWLNSLFIDSIGYYYRSSSIYPSNYQRFVKKYFALNLITIRPMKGLDLSFGNSAVYKGEFKPEMMLPFMFFKYLDRDLGKGSIEDSNGQLFFDLKYNTLQSLQIYYTFFLDVTSIRELVKGENWSTWFGVTIGSAWFDAYKNIDVTLEYTRLNPWLYEHKDSTTTYKHLNYPLGHWMGQNSDQLRLQIDYIPAPQYYGSLYFERVRKGGIDSIETVYKYKIEKPFLYGELRNEIRIGATFAYEYMHDLIARITYEYSDIKDDDKKRFPAWQLGKNNLLSLSLQYGL